MEVAQTYNTIAHDFSKTRYSVWGGVRTFLDSLPPQSLVGDIGCGNGKNMLYRDDLDMIGLEYSKGLCDICKSRLLPVVQGDARSIPFQDNTFDAIIMIAVIHHIIPDEHHKVLSEIQRVLRPGGICLITNWAVEQPEGAKRQFHKGLNMVTWKGKETLPLPYWVMDKELANEFINNLPSGLKFMNLEWEAGNWNILLTKVSKTS